LLRTARSSVETRADRERWSAAVREGGDERVAEIVRSVVIVVPFGSFDHIVVWEGSRLGYGRTITFPRLCPLSTSR
jgi:hypothetical protein